MIIPVRMITAAAKHANRVTIALLQCKVVAVGEGEGFRVEAWFDANDLTGYLHEPVAVSITGPAARAIAKALAPHESAELRIEGGLVELRGGGVVARARGAPAEPPELKGAGRAYIVYPLRLAYLWCRKHPHALAEVKGEGEAIHVGPVALETWNPVEPFSAVIRAEMFCRAYESVREYTNPDRIGPAAGLLAVGGAGAQALIEVVEG